jgi:hypothetical protein
MELDGPRAKYDRATYHLGVLDSNSVRFVETEPFYVQPEFNEAERGFILRFRQREDVPLVFSTTVGDLIHNLRSALDHAAWLLAARSISLKELWDEKNATKISFPIASSPERLHKGWLWSRLANDAKTLLEELQPYHAEGGPQSHPFCRLNRLWNIDKHRVLHAGFARIDFSSVSFRPGGIDIDSLSYEVERRPLAGEIHDGAEIAIVRFKGAPKQHEVTLRMGGQPTAELLFGSKGMENGLSIVDFLEIAGHVNDALLRIANLPEVDPSRP